MMFMDGLMEKINQMIKKKIIGVIKFILPQKMQNVICAMWDAGNEYAEKQRLNKRLRDKYISGGGYIGTPKRWKVLNDNQFKVGANIHIGADSDIWVHSKNSEEQSYNNEQYEGQVVIGNNVHIGSGLKIDCYTSITIDDDALLATKISFIDTMHGINPEEEGSYVKQSMRGKPITVKRGVWIGEGAIILAGSIIGERAIIGAGAVVSGSIPPYTIAVGVPARVIKKWDSTEKKWNKVE